MYERGASYNRNKKVIMDIGLITAFVGLIGVGLGALIQYYFGKRSNKDRKLIDIRSQAYLDLLNAVSDIASSAKYSKPRDLELLEGLNAAKTKVILIGSNEVVEEVHNFFTKYESLHTDASIKAFSSIVAAMRSDLAGKNSLSNNLLSEALFGKDIQFSEHKQKNT